MKMTLLSFVPVALGALTLGASSLHAKDKPVAEVGKPAPEFSLPGADGKTHSLAENKGKVVVLEWTNPECPFVKKFYNVGAMQEKQKAAVDKGVVWFRINSGAPGKQGAQTPEQLKAYDEAQKVAATTSIADPESKVATLYGARTTPHLYVINAEGVLVYNGAIDDKPTPSADDIKGARDYVAEAVAATLEGKPVETATSKPYGCSVKYAD